MPVKTTRDSKIQTTLRLPAPLYRRAKKLVEAKRAKNLNDFFTAALSAYIRATERHNIDSDFALMADDDEYQREAQAIAKEFAESDAETLEQIDSPGPRTIR